MSATTIFLLKQYLSDVDRAVDILASSFGEGDVFGAYRSKRIPRVGVLKEFNLKYHFHGSGCEVEFLTDGLIVDFDFGPGGRVDGVDPWKVSQYYENNDIYEDQFEAKQFEADFASLVAGGELVNPDWSPGSSLYYFKELIH